MFRERLAAIASRLDGLQFASIVAADGIRVESYEPSTGGAVGLDPDSLAVELLTQIKAISESHGELGLGELTQYTISTDGVSVMIGKVAPAYYLMLLMVGVAGLGRARFELRRASLVFEDDLV